MTVSFAIFSQVKNVSAAELSVEEKLQYDLDAIVIPTEAKMSFPVTTVSAYGNKIEYTSSNPEVISTNNQKTGWLYVARSKDVDQTATITVTVTDPTDATNTKSKTSEVSVPKGETQRRKEYVFIGYDNDVIEKIKATGKYESEIQFYIGDDIELPVIDIENYDFVGYYYKDDEGNEHKYEFTTTLGLLNSVELNGKYVAKEIESIEVSGNYKTEYNAKETFDASGLIVEGVKLNGDKVTLTTDQYKIVYQNNKTELHADDTSVDVVYTVNEKIKVSITGLTVNKLTYSFSETDFTLGEADEARTTEIVYDNEEHTLKLLLEKENELKTKGNPYEITYPSVKEVNDTNEYTVTFNVLDTDYVSIDALQISLTVKTLEIDLTPYINVDMTKVYNGNPQAPELKWNEQGNTLAEYIKEAAYLDSYGWTKTDADSNGGTDIPQFDFKSKNDNISFTGPDYLTFGILKKEITENDVEITGVVSVVVVKAREYDNNLWEEVFNMKNNIKITYNGEELQFDFINVEGQRLYKDIPSGEKSVQQTVQLELFENYTFVPSVTISFTTTLSSETCVKEDKQNIINEYSSIPNVEVGTVLTTKSSTDSIITYTTTDSSLTIANNEITNVVYGETAKTIKVYVHIVNGDAEDYVEVEVTIPLAPKSFTDETTSVALSNVPGEVSSVTVTEVDANVQGTYSVADGYSVHNAWDITLNGLTTTDYKVKVKLPISGFTSKDEVKVYHVKSDGTLEEVENITVADDLSYVEFVATSFSAYVVAKKNATSQETKKGWVKITEEPTDWSGKYLIVYEKVENETTTLYVFNSTLETLDAENNYLTSNYDDAYFEIEKTTVGDYTIMSRNDKYIGRSLNKNGLEVSDEALTNTITFNEDGSVKIMSSVGNCLQFNNATNQMRFRYFGSSQKPICLYKWFD